MFFLSSLESWASPPAIIVAPALSLGDSILEKLYKDKESHDVFFVFTCLDDDMTSGAEDSDMGLR
ncbi:hypothetical protein BG005_005726, partial [Podila minutissima]